jgi:hypothetical protein
LQQRAELKACQPIDIPDARSPGDCTKQRTAKPAMRPIHSISLPINTPKCASLTTGELIAAARYQIAQPEFQSSAVIF